MIPVNLKFCLNGLFFVKVNINMKQLIVLCGTRIIKLFVTGDNTNLVDAQYAQYGTKYSRMDQLKFLQESL